MKAGAGGRELIRGDEDDMAQKDSAMPLKLRGTSRKGKRKGRRGSKRK